MEDGRSNILQDLSAIRGFVTAAEASAIRAAGRPALPRWDEPEAEAPDSQELEVPEAISPLERALATSRARAIPWEETEARLVALEGLEALCIGVILAGGGGPDRVEEYARHVRSRPLKPFPSALVDPVARISAPLLAGEAMGSDRASQIREELLRRFRRKRGGVPRPVRSRFLAFVRRQMAEAREGGRPDLSETRVLHELLQAHDACRAQLLEDNLSLAPQAMYRAGIRYDVRKRLLVSAVEGLRTALTLFDPTMKNRLSTYSFYRVRVQVRRDREASIRPVRFTHTAWDPFKKIRQAENDFLREHGRMPSLSELSEATGVPVRKLEEQLATMRMAPKSETPRRSDGAWASDLAVDRDRPSIAESEWLTQGAALLLRAVSRLEDRLRYVITRRYGLDRREPATLSAVGTEMGLSRERTRQIERMALFDLEVVLSRIAAARRRLYRPPPVPSTPPTSRGDPRSSSRGGKRE